MATVDFKDLNLEQQQAVQHTEGPLLILAGAGSGKTRVLVTRIQYILELQKGDPPGICALTFTNKAARELRTRVQDQLGKKVKSLWTGTFHSFGLQLLRKNWKRAGLNKQFSIIDHGDCHGVIKDLLINIKNDGKQDFKIETLMAIINRFRAGYAPDPDWSEDYVAVAHSLLPKYQKKLRQLGVVDFEDLLLKPLALMEEHVDLREKMQQMFPYVMVDEFQDTNNLQMKLIRLLTEGKKNIAVVGDDDQAIYGWRGAQVKNILNFPQQFSNCRVIQLEKNYRSSASILNLANDIIKNNKNRHGKILRPTLTVAGEKKPEVFVFENDQEEVERVTHLIQDLHKEGVPFKDIAILYRSNSQGDFMETELRLQQVPYSLSGGSGFFEKREVKDVVAYLRCMWAPKEVDMRRILNVPPRGIGDESLKKIEEWAELRKTHFPKAALEMSESLQLPERGRKGLAEFFSHISSLRSSIKGHDQVDYEVVILKFLQDLGYRDYLRRYCKNDELLQRRWSSLAIIVRVLKHFVEKSPSQSEGIQKFLDVMSLRDYGENIGSEVKDEVQLLTLHAAKGLEFPYVFIIGVEEDILPHRQLGQNISEERRLFYVGVTRAQTNLVISRARQRKKFGRFQDSAPSRFLLEVDPKFLETYEQGFRPVSENVKEDLLASLRAKLDKSMSDQQIEP